MNDRLRFLLVRRINRALSPMGLRLQKFSCHDLREKVGHPLEALSVPLLRRPIVVDIEMERIRGLGWFRLSASSHPFVAALERYARGGGDEYGGSPLEAYYEACQPANVREALGLDDGGRACSFSDMHPFAAVFPWMDATPVEREAHRRGVEVREVRGYGMDLSDEDGSKLFGPVSYQKGTVELRRLIKVYESMKRKGYVRRDKPDGDVAGTMLMCTSEEWCIQLWQGHHRAAAAAALGLDRIPVRIAEAPVRRSDVAFWPQVVARRFSEEAALGIFDRVMRADPPPVYQFGSSLVSPGPQTL